MDQSIDFHFEKRDNLIIVKQSELSEADYSIIFIHGLFDSGEKMLEEMQ